MTSQEPEASSGGDAPGRLCQSCGLCCDGSFFGSVELREGDDVAALGAVVPLAPNGVKMVFQQPCAALRGGCCTVYANRPQVCRRYRCRVLRGVEVAPARLPEALERVAGMRASLARSQELLRAAGFPVAEAGLPAAIKAFRAAYAAALKAGDAAFFARHRELILSWKKTAWVIHEHFDEKAAARLALPVRETGTADAP